MLQGKSILVTGGTGSFGKKFVETVLRDHNPKKVIVFSRDELKQYEMSLDERFKDNEKLRYFIGDIRDGERMERACEGVDVIIHAAALKQVPAAEYNPMECIKTNVLGSQNVINAALNCGVSRVVALSTDKAAAPVNLYGATKLCSDKLFTAANNMIGKRDLKLSVVRYGNVMGSRGSVIPFFMSQRHKGMIPITHEAMTRFNILIEEGVAMVLYALEHAWGGEIFVPKIPSYNIMAVAEAVAPNCRHQIVGIRPGEKLHEEMVTESDAEKTIDCGKYYVILPSTINWSLEDYMNKFKAVKVPKNFRYNSGDNDQWVNVDEIRALIKKHVDTSFEVQ
jgi:UDP-N-acetylglucosamine 4,6-dehydratase